MEVSLLTITSYTSCTDCSSAVENQNAKSRGMRRRPSASKKSIILFHIYLGIAVQRPSSTTSTKVYTLIFIMASTKSTIAKLSKTFLS